jgi:hypothetical protein
MREVSAGFYLTNESAGFGTFSGSYSSSPPKERMGLERSTSLPIECDP